MGGMVLVWANRMVRGIVTLVRKGRVHSLRVDLLGGRLHCSVGCLRIVTLAVQHDCTIMFL